MHENSLRIMREMLETHTSGRRRMDVLAMSIGGYHFLDPDAFESWHEATDVGAFDICGTYRPIVEELGFRSYTGADLSPGPNVDVVLDACGDIPDEHLARYPVVISGQCLEHVRQPWKLVEGYERLLAPGGLLIVIAPWSSAVHEYPIDCWRVLPEGMQGVFDHAGIEMLAKGMSEIDTYAVGRKPAKEGVVST